MLPQKLPTVFMYLPEQWDYVDRFAKWYGAPFVVSQILSNSLQTIIDHRNKFKTLAARATLLIPELVEERKQLDQQGYSNMAKAMEFTGIIETLICELYSCLDGLRNTIYSIYKDVQGVQKKSTEKMFKNAAQGNYGNGFPSKICALLKVAYEDWFLKLRRLRVELTHGRVGTCSMQDELCISYIHYALGSEMNVFVIDDIINWVNTHANHVNVLLNEICEFWYNQLEPREVIEACGVHRGRFMGRAIIITEPVTQDSGLCLFRHVYEEEPEFACPLRDSCAAYARVGNRSREVIERVIAKQPNIFPEPIN